MGEVVVTNNIWKGFIWEYMLGRIKKMGRNYYDRPDRNWLLRSVELKCIRIITGCLSIDSVESLGVITIETVIEQNSLILHIQ